MPNVDLIIDPPAAGAWNMAVDEALLLHANETGQGTLRIYRWSEPTLSLGYFQKVNDRERHKASLDCKLVRRSSGGGAILHDRELTYSLALPGTNRWSSKQNDLYGTIHAAIVRFLNKNGVAAEQFEFPVKDGLLSSKEPINFKSVGYEKSRFLCFERRTEGDIVLGGYKVGGSAQRRLSHATLQHGSLLLERSKQAPELPGIFDLAKPEFCVEGMTEGLVESLVDALGGVASVAELSSGLIRNAKQIHDDKYNSTDWTCKR